jgi:hypothetical protein
MRRLPHPRTKFCIGNICCGVKSTLSDSGLLSPFTISRLPRSIRQRVVFRSRARTKRRGWTRTFSFEFLQTFGFAVMSESKTSRLGG